MPRDPYFPSLRHEVDRLFDTLVHTAWGVAGQRAAWCPPVDLSEDAQGYRVEMDLPGIAPKDLSVTAQGTTLRIEGSRQRRRWARDERHHLVERTCGAFVRLLRLPADADLEHLRTHLENGLLTLEVPKHARRRG